MGRSPPAKRKKYDGEANPPYINSSYFESPDGKHRIVGRIDLVSNGSQDDVYEIRSTSSVGKPKGSAIYSQDEFRHAQPKTGKHKKVRDRKSRKRSFSQQSSVDHHQPSSSESKTPGRGVMPGSWDGPDVLTVPDNDPPAANIRSDLVKSSPAKRMLPAPSSDHSTPHVKRPRVSGRAESIESEDELSRQAPNPNRPNNFSDLAVSPRQTKSRGDIHQTVFKKRARIPRIPDLCVKSAVCGKDFFPKDRDVDSHIVLRQTEDGARLTPRSPKNFMSQLDWLSVDLDSAESLQHAATKNRFVRVTRPIKGNSGSVLWLEFLDEQDVMSLIQATPRDKTKERPA